MASLKPHPSRCRFAAPQDEDTIYSAACKPRIALAGLGAPTRSRRSHSDSMPPNAIRMGPNQISRNSGLWEIRTTIAPPAGGSPSEEENRLSPRAGDGAQWVGHAPGGQLR